MFKQFVLCILVVLLVKPCQATYLFELVAEDVIEREGTLEAIQMYIKRDNEARQNKQKRRHQVVMQINLPTDLLKYKILPYDVNSDLRVVDEKNQDDKTAVETIPMHLVLSAERLAKRRRIKDFLEQCAHDPEYK